tara:strand:- start:4498 stop:4998 length:501 start_codon:yes stop_codon:yes gene_type:complete
MKTSKFVFQIIKGKWTENLLTIKNCLFKRLDELITESTQSFEITISPYSPEKSAKQLMAYWVLIKVVREYINNQQGGYEYSPEEISDYFKIEAGHCIEVSTKCLGKEKEKKPRSISKKSKTTREEMRNLINTIIEFGAIYDIEGCYIEDKELKDMLSYFKQEVKHD